MSEHARRRHESQRGEIKIQAPVGETIGTIPPPAGRMRGGRKKTKKTDHARTKTEKACEMGPERTRGHRMCLFRPRSRPRASRVNTLLEIGEKERLRPMAIIKTKQLGWIVRGWRGGNNRTPLFVGGEVVKVEASYDEHMERGWAKEVQTGIGDGREKSQGVWVK